MKKWGSGILMVTLILFGGVWRLLAQSAPIVVINELAWAGSTLSASDEWIELHNTTDAELDISGWQLTKLTNDTETPMLSLPASSPIPANGYFLISNFDADNSVIDITPNLVDVAVSLSNSALQIKLYNGNFATEGVLIDTAGDGVAPPAGDNALKISMERRSDLNGWQDASEATNLDAGVSDLGTPLADNSAVISPPTLLSLSPATAINDQALEIEEIRGTGFSIDLQPILKLKLGSQEIVASNLNVVGPELIDHAQFNIQDAEIGQWDLVLTNPDGQTATLPKALKIEEPVIPPDLSTTVRLSEIYPRPNSSSNDEFIELYNFGDTTIDLAGWQIDDVPNSGSQPYVFETRSMAPKSFLTLYKLDTRLTLNDSADRVLLIQPNHFVLDEVDYETAPKGQSLARFTNGWEWTETPTPNGLNILTQTVPEPESESPPLEADDPTPADASPTPSTYAPHDLIITELLPNPKDGEEFIEIFNPTQKEISLLGWALKDASDKKFSIGKNDLQIQTTTIIKPNQFIYIPQTISKIQLNNSGGETVELISPSGKIIDSVSYPDNAPPDAALAHYDESSWTWTSQPTPGQMNIVILEETAIALTPPTLDEPMLPSAGTATRQWLGMILMSISLASMLMWYKYNYEIDHY